MSMHIRVHDKSGKGVKEAELAALVSCEWRISIRGTAFAWLSRCLGVGSSAIALTSVGPVLDQCLASGPLAGRQPLNSWISHGRIERRIGGRFDQCLASF